MLHKRREPQLLVYVISLVVAEEDYILFLDQHQRLLLLYTTGNELIILIGLCITRRL